MTRYSASAGLLLLPNVAGAHSTGDPVHRHELWSAWNLEPWLLVVIAATLLFYFRGWTRVRGSGGSDRRTRQAASFSLGMALIIIALVSPLDALSAQLSSAHMVQHMLLIAAAAPLLVLGRPLPYFLWAMPEGLRSHMVQASARPWFNAGWRFLTQPLTAWLLHGAVLWAWHAPTLYQAALADPLVHDLEHASFLANALLFWWVVLRTLSNGSASNGIAVALLFTTFMHGGLLAALMTFANSPWYPAYLETTAAWNLTGLEDQQLAGLIMWIPVGVTYLVAGLAVLALWLGGMERTTPGSTPVNDKHNRSTLPT